MLNHSPISSMELPSPSKPRIVNDHPSDFVHVDTLESITVQDLIQHVKQTPDTTQLLQLLEQARDLHIQLFHFAAATGDREFYANAMAFLPIDAFVKELLLPNQNRMTAIQCAKTTNPSLANDIESFLLSRGVILIRNFPGFVVAEDPHLKRVNVGPSRYVVCSNTASTVGLTLRANAIHYAAKRAVYVQQVRLHKLDELAFYGDKLLAFSESDTTLSVVWSGSKIADLAKEEGFRAKFKVFTSCKYAGQQLTRGMSVLLDLENLSPPPSAKESLMILRLYPSEGRLGNGSNTPANQQTTISSSGVRVADLGYRDDQFLKGFRRGWYNESIYFRCVGDHPNCFLSGGNASNSTKFDIREEHDFGYDNTRVMIELPDEGVVYCRGVGDNHTNPEMACVLFDHRGNARERYAYLGKLGRWSDIVQ
ncbi:hypothetical protein L914_04620 [Phytophthora nicotianae]|uniref:Uncharacterized protein n=1 Tax=Phytophthora nicotianae TaxID=4792 RepID=W2NSH1_PHYNI|nr:hypothetical protein L914_04620 [Phytophthora nicotianae]